jgi:hypothetical protein
MRYLSDTAIHIKYLINLFILLYGFINNISIKYQQRLDKFDKFYRFWSNILNSNLSKSVHIPQF